MNELLDKVRGLQSTNLSILVRLKLSNFSKVRGSALFNELCYCLLTANYNAEKSMMIQDSIGDGFMHLGEKALSSKLRSLGYRYPNVRAKYITEARSHAGALNKILKMEESEAREWLVNNVMGLGMKEASHFLRNIGFTDCAIVDFHIIDVLVRNDMLSKPKSLSRSKYLEIEGLLRGLARELGMNLAELDLYLWYLETGKVLK